MARRRELADVADGIGGPFIRQDWYSSKTRPMAAIERGHKRKLGTSFSFDLIAGVADPASRELSRLAVNLARELTRHLRARHISDEWVHAATLTVTFDEVLSGNRPTGNYQCLVTIMDDLGSTHTSTRRSALAEAGKETVLQLIFGAIVLFFGFR